MGREKCKPSQEKDSTESTYVDRGVVMDDAILNDLREFLFRHTKCGVHLLKRICEIVRVDPQVLHIVRYARYCANLDMSIECKTSRALDQPADLRARKVLGELRELFEVHVSVHHTVLTHLHRVNGQDLIPPMLVWQ